MHRKNQSDVSNLKSSPECEGIILLFLTHEDMQVIALPFVIAAESSTLIPITITQYR